MPRKPVEPREATVIVVEDDEMVLKIIVKVLHKLGVPAIIEARNGDEAWQILSERKDEAHLVICDWNMPRLNGISLLKKIRGECLDIRFMMLTGRGEMASAVEAKAAGADAFAFKPYSPFRLMEKVAALLRGDIEDDAEGE